MSKESNVVQFPSQRDDDEAELSAAAQAARDALGRAFKPHAARLLEREGRRWGLSAEDLAEMMLLLAAEGHCNLRGGTESPAAMQATADRLEAFACFLRRRSAGAG